MTRGSPQPESAPTPSPHPFSAKLIAQSLDFLAAQTQGNPDYILTLAQPLCIFLEAPSPSGGKFWSGIVMEIGLSMRWGKMASQGQVKHIPLRSCRQHNAVLELKHRALEKLAKGYVIAPHRTVLP